MTQTKTETVEIRHQTVGELVADDYRKAEVFKQFGIDFCCGGGQTVSEVCRKKGLSFDLLANELQKIEDDAVGSEPHDANTWDLDVLVEYVVNVHHKYVRANIPLLKEFTTKVARVHGHANPEVTRIATFFAELAAELELHMMKEERILFPYIKQMVEDQKRNAPRQYAPFGSVQNPVRMMEHEHDRAGSIMREIRQASQGFTPPEHACTTYRVSYFKLEEFEADLHRHIHLENNILFPKAIALEQRLSTV